ncbi:hypothetical protein ACVJ1F_002148, partial [Frigoribacterium sp. 2355]
RLEGDTSFSKELDDLGGRHVASIDATCSTADPLSGAITDDQTSALAPI